MNTTLNAAYDAAYGNSPKRYMLVNTSLSFAFSYLGFLFFVFCYLPVLNIYILYVIFYKIYVMFCSIRVC